MSTQVETSGRWGRFGGRYVAEALWQPLEEVAQGLDAALANAAFLERYERWLDFRVGRPTPISCMTHLSAARGGGRLWLKREDLCQGGSFCTNLAIFQALLAQAMGRTGLVTETATGDFGVALGAIGAALGMQVRVFMGREDMHAEPSRVAQMKHLGVELTQVDASTRGRKMSRPEALRLWMAHHHELFYCTSLLASPDPYPRMIASALEVIGAETRVQLRRRGCEPDYIIAPIGSGGFGVGLLGAFTEDDSCHLVGIQAGGEPQGGRHAASLISGRPGVFHGTMSNVLQDQQGQVQTPYSVAGGLCVAAVGPQHASWAARGRVLYTSINDEEARQAARELYRLEGISIALEAAHAVAYALKLLETLGEDRDVVVGISGAGDRDLERLGES